MLIVLIFGVVIGFVYGALYYNRGEDVSVVPVVDESKFACNYVLGQYLKKGGRASPVRQLVVISDEVDGVIPEGGLSIGWCNVREADGNRL
jgi:hypothetical protein